MARGHYLEAVWHWDRGACAQADSAFERALLFDPASPWLTYDRGRALLDCGHRVEGAAHLRTAAAAGVGAAWGVLAEDAAANGGSEEVALAVESWSQADISVADMAWRGRWRVDVGDLEGGFEDLVRGLPERPRDLQGMAALLNAATRLQRLQTAFVVLEGGQALHPTNQQLLRWLGDLSAEVGDERTALQSYRSLDRLTGRSDPEVWRDLARSALRTGNRDLARDLLSRTSHDASLTAGLLALVGQGGAAEALLDTAQAAAPLDRTLALRRAEIRHRSGDLAGALEAVAATPGLAPEAQARLSAEYRIRSGDLAGALATLTPHEDQLGVARMRVRVLLDLERPQEALEASELGLQRWASDPVLRVRRVLALEALERRDEALAGAHLLLEADPENVDAVLVLARQTEPSPALEGALWQALEGHPGEVDLWLELARLRWLRGAQEEAIVAAERAGWLLGRDRGPGERYAPMCAELPCRGQSLEEG